MWGCDLHPLPAGWTQILSKTFGEYYYYHPATETKTWIRPTQASRPVPSSSSSSSSSASARTADNGDEQELQTAQDALSVPAIPAGALAAAGPVSVSDAQREHGAERDDEHAPDGH